MYNQRTTRIGQAIVGNALRMDRPLTDDEIRQVAPSVFAIGEAEYCSDKYSFVPTYRLLSALRDNGFEPFMAVQSKKVNPDLKEYAKHMLRFRHVDQLKAGNSKGLAQEVIFIGSHDTSSSAQIAGGLFRDACQNGLVWGDPCADFRVRHSGDAMDNVIDGVYTVLGNFDQMDASLDNMQATKLNDDERIAFAKAALALRYEEDSVPVYPEDLLRARRRSDMETDVFTTFNVIQENLLKGGPSRSIAGKRKTVRGVKSIDTNIALNRGLWTLADEMLRLKGVV